MVCFLESYLDLVAVFVSEEITGIHICSMIEREMITVICWKQIYTKFSVLSRKQNKPDYLQSLIICKYMKRLKSVYWDITIHLLFKTLRDSLTSYSLLLHPNQPLARSLILQLELVWHSFRRFSWPRTAVRIGLLTAWISFVYACFVIH